MHLKSLTFCGLSKEKDEEKNYMKKICFSSNKNPIKAMRVKIAHIQQSRE
jgi:hypothetical protein